MLYSTREREGSLMGIVGESLTLSVIITAHAEGILLHRTIASVRRALELLPQSYSYEIILHVDNGSSETLEYINSHKNSHLRGIVVHCNTFGDLGKSRNFAISQAKGKYISTIDADDLMSESWLSAAISHLDKTKNDTVAHSEYTVEFEGANGIIKKYGEIDFDTDALLSVYANRWNSVIVAPRKILLTHPYQPNSPGYGYEDWNLNCNLIFDKVHNILIPGTAIFVRRKKDDSEWARQIHSAAVLRANPLLSFDTVRSIKQLPAVFLKQPIQERVPLIMRVRRKAANNRVVRKLALPLRNRFLVKASEFNMPEWLKKEWNNLHTIDRQIFLSPQLQASIQLYDTITDEHLLTGSLYKYIVDQLHFNTYRYILFVPWLTHGGADRYSINYANKIAKLTNEKVLLVATLPIDSPWKSELDEGIDFLEFGKIVGSASNFIKHRLLEHIIENSGADTLHIINSELGYEFIQKHATYIKATKKKVILTSFSQSIDIDNGRVYGYSHTHVPPTYALASLITSDNKAVVDMWISDYGFSPERLRVHRQPIDTSAFLSRSKRAITKPMKVLWAGRISDEKLPYVVRDVGNILSELIKIDMYGTVDSKYQDFITSLPSSVQYKGPYDGFDSIDVSDYDILLYTSLFDGMPNVLLEAAAKGLPIIASDSGGISELINDSTGILVRDRLSPDAYVSAIQQAIDEPQKLALFALNAKERLDKEFSQDIYDKAIQEMLNAIGFKNS